MERVKPARTGMEFIQEYVYEYPGVAAEPQRYFEIVVGTSGQ